MATTEVIRKPLMSGHCAVGNKASHERCQRNGGFQRANPLKEFQPCPCSCHYGTGVDGGAEVYECGSCGRAIVEAIYWPLDEDGDIRYTHIDETGRALGENCEGKSAAVSGNEPPPEKDCSRCGSVFRGTGRGRLCPACVSADEAEAAAKAAAEDDFSDLDFEDEDDFSDLDDL